MDQLQEYNINKFIFFCDNVLNFHGSDDSYYEEWYDDIKEEGGWICLINVLEHVEQEMKDTQLQYYINFGGIFNDVNWRVHTPRTAFQVVENLLENDVKRLVY